MVLTLRMWALHALIGGIVTDMSLHQQIVAVLVALSVLFVPVVSHAQDAEENSSREFQLASPLLQGQPAPFSGILLGEDDFRLALRLDAASQRWEREARVFERQLETERRLYEAFISEQRARINQLSERSWWDENGALLMFGLGTALGVVVSAIIVGLATN